MNGDTAWWRIRGPAVLSLVVALVAGCAGQAAGPPTGSGPNRTIQSVLDAQSVALLNGDEAGFLAQVDPTQPDLVARYRDLFATLRGLLVTGWHATVSNVDGEAPLQAPDRPVDVTVGYCLGLADCSTELTGAGLVARAAIRMSFAVSGGGIVITGLLPAARSAGLEPAARRRSPLGAAPWQLSSLHAMSGARTVVAAPAAQQDRLPAALAAAEAAALVADQYPSRVRPERYYVYLAGPDEWNTWFGLAHGIEIARTVTTSPRSMDIVVRADRVPDHGLESLLRKEIGRVATHLGTNLQQLTSDRQWVSEGVAELVKNMGESRSSIEAEIGSLRHYVATLSSVDAFLDRGLPTEATAGAAFSTASYLAITYISYRFGSEPLIQFVDAVLRARMPVPRAAAQVLGLHWEDLKAEFWYAVVLL